MGSAHDDTAQEGQTKVNTAKHILVLCCKWECNTLK